MSVKHYKGMEYAFHFQDPTCSETVYLFEALIEAIGKADECSGIFAFASRPGVDALITDPAVTKFLSKSRLSLLLGIDAITDRRALERLRELQAVHGDRLVVEVFLPHNSGIFHPKIAYFHYPNGHSTLIVGSGNLTPGGMRNNFEAYSVCRATRGEVLDMSSYERFRKLQAANISIITEEVLKRAEKNVFTRRKGHKGERKRKDTSEIIAEHAVEIASQETQIGPAQQVLIARVPKAGGRWGQVHFNRQVIEQFFRVKPNDPNQRVYLSEITTSGIEKPQEVRPCVYSNTNKNYKIELGAARGREYPTGGTPIVVMLELQVRSFEYTLLMPGEKGYSEMEQVINAHPSLGKGLARVIILMEQLRSAWANNPFS